MVEKKVVAIVLARGGSKGIPGKNLVPFCGKPLLQWTLDQLKEVPELHSIWVSSDNEAILCQATVAGCRTIHRPLELSGDQATSESGWRHALDVIEQEIDDVDLVAAVQATSPIRDPEDVSRAIAVFTAGDYDSMFSASPAKDLCLWSMEKTGPKSMSYDSSNPNRRRQETFGERWIENGSFYLFTPAVLIGTGTRFGNKIGVYPMAYHKMFEIDEPEDLNLCEVVMQAHLEGRL
jgi:N-acylneuraminate cytidylyltransferase